MVAGAALAGFGFSLGRDVYSGTKKKAGYGGIWTPIVIVIVALPLVLSYLSGLLLFRGHKTAADRFTYFVIGIASFVGAVTLGALPLLIAAIIVLAPFIEPSAASPIPNFLVFLEDKANAFWIEFLQSAFPKFKGVTADHGAVALVKWLIPCCIFLVGALVGLRQRSRRVNAWAAQSHNEVFLREVGLTEKENGEFEDGRGNAYRFEYRGQNYLELLALGRRNKRGYLHFDETGKFIAWSGLVKKSGTVRRQDIWR